MRKKHELAYFGKMRPIDQKIFRIHNSTWHNTDYNDRCGPRSLAKDGLLIKVLETGETFETFSECAERFGVGRDAISKIFNPNYYNKHIYVGDRRYTLIYIRNPKWIHNKEIVKSDIANMAPELLPYMNSYKDWIDLYLEDLYGCSELEFDEQSMEDGFESMEDEIY